MRLSGVGEKALGRAVIAAASLLVGLGAQPAGAANLIAQRADGGIVLAGQLGQPPRDCRKRPELFGISCTRTSGTWPALVGLGPDGELDRGFGSEGATIDFRPFSAYAGGYVAVAVDERGQILTGGGDSPMLRFDGDGSPDPSYSVQGYATAILPQPDGSLILSEPVWIGVKQPDSRLTLKRVGPSGQPLGQVGFADDNEYGFLEIGSVAQLGDSLFAAGLVGEPGSAVLRFRLGAGPHADPAFAGGTGILRVGAAGATTGDATKIAIDGDGILVAGEPAVGESVVARYDSNGALDGSFGEGGVVRLDLEPAAMVSGPGGAIRVVGQRNAPCRNPGPNSRAHPTVPCAHAFLQTIEPGAAVAGPPTVLPLPPRGRLDALLTGEGRLLVSSTSQTGSSSRFAVTRLNPGGSVDSSFGDGGVTVVAPCQESEAARRRVGCIGSVEPRLGLAGLAGGRPHGSLRLVDRQVLDPIVGVRLMLPEALRGVRGTSRLVKVATVPHPSPEMAVSVSRGRILVDPKAKVGRVAIGLRPGVLRRVAPAPPGHKLVFDVLTTFASGTTQRSTVRLAP
jgi:uncharacterized delta-60 repeat protein